MLTDESIRPIERPTGETARAAPDLVDPVTAAETILRRYGARAITLLSSPRTLDDGRRIAPRLSPNDCYVAMEEACRKMARVALRKRQTDPKLAELTYKDALNAIFPDPVAYLTRCIRSVVSDSERAARRDVPTVSIDQPLSSSEGDGILLGDTLSSADNDTQPETALVEKDERLQFRAALSKALTSIPVNYREALQRDISREKEREYGRRVAPESDRERQTVCRARAAVSTILRRECGPDNPFIRQLAQQRSSRVRAKSTPSSNWTAERQSSLFNRLLGSSWAERASDAPDGSLEEAVVNEVGSFDNVAPPSPQMRQAMRVMDTYTLDDDPRAVNAEAQSLYERAKRERSAGRIEEATRLYRGAYEAEPGFFAAYNEVGVMLSQAGNLRDALKVYLEIIERAGRDDHRFIAATNAADIYLTWYDAGRNKDRNIERATYFARLAMERPTPMRACNLLLALAKDRYFLEARQVMEAILRENAPTCSAEKFLRTLFQIRDADLIAWWTWLEGEMGEDTIK